ncbi:interferon-induced protein with tetratricopeptide repeats 5-like [Neoarius graeffei]|uniref:interferon-induced protein with tetratricopeptide repeats 5-like n=1 Tax=Neoarius graeffei TaxID=443677 RepID=UPI00298CC639|nr:interferon-induced protein with tetratricopeptide repeats 5-like [Neoarius graeffei]XP_060794827.1 interferon-induced protein with tetratricopeptide repeats 5-like [Neoarius graeffei]XP_060794828.1 interferon-induced protein with tetratricopeptide repeats 5-like [Neoarius graeffei]XP_060794829.1 interferon-induced protein with tetratricopeptide repeats 5-like [Neoarius graeffei]XP_060794830.1 interferon-induced protein with tetratricopeptide repeats 5-like [Neoarius graeffei]XP_060794831.1 
MGVDLNRFYLYHCSLPDLFSQLSFIHACDSVISFSTSSTQDTFFKTRLLQLECHFTWALNKNDVDLTDLLNRLEEQLNLDLGGETGAARAHSYKGFVKFLLGSNTEALSNFERSVELTKSRGNDCDKLFVVAYGDLAWLYYHMGNFTECESYLSKLSEIKVKYPSVPYAEVLGEKGWTFLKFSQKYYEWAKKCFKKALELEPEDPEWNAGLAIALYRLEYNLQNSAVSTETSTENSTDQLRWAIATNPDDDVLKVLLALRLTVDKKYNEAESLVEQALESSPEHPNVLRYVAKFLRNQGSVDRSIALLKTALEKVTNAAFIHHQLGLCYKQKIQNLRFAGSHHRTGAEIKQAQEQCIYHLEIATKLKTGFILAMSDLALQYGVKRDMQRAEEMFHNAFQTAKERNENCQYVHLCYAEFQQYSMKCEPAAIKHYTECLNLNPKTYHGKKSAESLKKIAKRRIENNPEDGEAFGILGIIHKEQGEKQQAIECFEKALSCEDNEDYLSHLCELQISLQ